MAQGKKEEAEEMKKKVTEHSTRLAELEAKESELEEKVKKNMMIIPNIIDPSVPIGKDDSQNVELERFGEPVVPDFEIPYHAEIMERLNGLDLDSARKVAGNGSFQALDASYPINREFWPDWLKKEVDEFNRYRSQ